MIFQISPKLSAYLSANCSTNEALQRCP